MKLGLSLYQIMSTFSTKLAPKMVHRSKEMIA